MNGVYFCGFLSDDVTESFRLQPSIICMPQLQALRFAGLVPKFMTLKSGMMVQVSLETMIEPNDLGLEPTSRRKTKVLRLDHLCLWLVIACDSCRGRVNATCRTTT